MGFALLIATGRGEGLSCDWWIGALRSLRFGDALTAVGGGLHSAGDGYHGTVDGRQA